MAEKKRRNKVPSTASPVTLRLGDLGEDVKARAGANTAYGSIVRRDLNRYYQLLKHTAMPFTAAEALLLAWLLNRDFDPSGSGYRYVWAHVEEALARFARAEREGATILERLLAHVNHDDFVSKLRALEPHQAMRVIDAVEQFWLLRPNGFLDPDSVDHPDWPLTDRVIESLCVAGLLHQFDGFVFRFRRDWDRKSGLFAPSATEGGSEPPAPASRSQDT